MTATPLTSPNDVIARVRSEMARLKISQSAASKEIGISPAALTQVLNGTYAADPTSQYEKLERWLEQKAQAAVLRNTLPLAPDFIPTPTATRIISALSYAQLAGDMAMIYGGAGLGKTLALKHFQSEINNVFVATMSPATVRVAAALEAICIALGTKSPPYGALRMHREACRRLNGSGGLLIIDEAQHLSESALDAIRAIHDETGIGIALVGNESLYSRMVGSSHAAHRNLDRLHSRIGKRLPLRRPTAADVEEIAAAFGVSEGKSLAVLREQAAKAGALRLVVKTLRLAGMEAGGAVPTTAHIEFAVKDLGV